MRPIPEDWIEVGRHDNRSEGMCAMEMAAYIAGEEHSDHPPCVDPVIAAFVRRVNDLNTDEERQQLKGFLVRILNTAGDEARSLRRYFKLIDLAYRHEAPYSEEEIRDDATLSAVWDRFCRRYVGISFRPFSKEAVKKSVLVSALEAPDKRLKDAWLNELVLNAIALVNTNMSKKIYDVQWYFLDQLIDTK